MKKVLITGITGQDGSYLVEFLVSKGYEVHGIIRRASTFNKERINHICVELHTPGAKFFPLMEIYLILSRLQNVIYNMKPDEVYYLNAQSHVRMSFDIPEYTGMLLHWGRLAFWRQWLQDYLVLFPIFQVIKT